MSHAIRIVAVAALIALLPSSAAAKWTRLNSAHFQFIGDAPPSQMREVAEKLEQFRDALTRALPGATATSPVPTIVLVFATDRSMNPVKPLFRGSTTDISGYMLRGEDLNYIAINGEYIDIALTTVFHEYAHLLVGDTIGNAPAWASEGLAEFYEMSEGRDGGKSVIIGRAPAHHVELLKGSTLIPIKELLSIDHGSPVYNEGIRRGVFYAQSWALVHYLTLGNKARAPQFRQYLTALRRGIDGQQAFTDAFGGDIAVLDRELFEYVRRFLFPALRMEFKDKVGGEADRGTTIEDLEGEIHVADLQARVGREKEAQPRLQAIVKRRPDAALAWTALGLIDVRADRLKEALPQLERAAGQAPRDSFVQTALGRALIADVSNQESDARSATLHKARDVLGRAVQADPDSSGAAGMLGYVELAIGADMPRAIELLDRASKLAPSHDWYRLLLAQALFRQGELQRAIDYLGTLVATGSSQSIRDDARRLLGAVANARLRPASVPAPAVAVGDRPLPPGSPAAPALPPARFDVSTRSSSRARWGDADAWRLPCHRVPA